MRSFSKLVFLFAILLMYGCGDGRQEGDAQNIHWDRDMCERCKMVVSERKYAAEIIDPKTNKAYKFDDIGCAVLWLEEEHIPWADKAIIWVTDASTGEWLNARKALYTDDSITPMAYGVAAFSSKTFPDGHKALNYAQILDLIKKIEAKNNERRGIVPQ